ncbi:MAG: efflux RND transporter permease subunit [Planctomycetes bacterium]|nr:efflux RND transporter permease subunit [Planctomycetota bacterium]
MSRLARLPLERPVGTTMLLVSLVVLGAVATVELPLGFVPVLDEPQVNVDAPWPGAHPLEALREVGEPLEEEVAQVPGVTGLSTTASAGHVRVEATFEHGAALALKRLEVRDAVARARDRLPAGVGHLRVEGDTGPLGGRAILQGRVAAGRDLSTAWDLLEHHLRRPLERTRGVARVALYGVEPPRARIDLDLRALRRHGLDPGAVLRGLDAQNADRDLGAVRDARLRHDVRLSARFSSLEEVRALPLAHGLRLGEVAQVTLAPPRLDYGRRLDGRYAVGLDVFKEPGANTVETVDRVLARLDEVRADPALRGLDVLVWQDAGEEIRRSLHGLLEAGLHGALLAVVVLYLFLRRAGPTVIVAAAIPGSLLVTCGAMLALGLELNVITMLGLMLGVGMLVDNAVVVMESIHRLQVAGVPPAEAARRGLAEVLLAVVASTATTVIVWSWVLVSPPGPLVFYLSGVAVTICLAVAASLLVSVTFIPLLAGRVRAAGGGTAREGRLSRLTAAYQALVGWTLRHRAASLLALLLLAGSAAAPLARLEKTGDPRTRQRAVAIHYDVADTATREALEAHVDEVEAWLLERRHELEFERLYSWYSERQGTFTWVYLPQERATAANLQRLRADLRAGLPRLAGVKLEVGDRLWGRRRGADDARRVPVALHGDDPEFLAALGARVEERLRGVEGVVQVSGPGRGGSRELTVHVDPDRCRALGLTPDDVGQVVRFALRGQPLRRLLGPKGEVELVTGVPEEGGVSPADLLQLPIPRATGEMVLLSAVADVGLGRTPERVQRQDRETTVWVEVEVDPALTTEAAQARIDAALEGLPLPDGYRRSWGGWGRDRDETLETMARGVALALLVVLMLMAALFESFTQPLAILITLPLAFSGAFWSLWLGGYDLDAVAFIGVIVLVGIVVNNGIVMVDRVNALRAEGLGRVEAVVTGCATRLRPVLMTAITTIVGLIPLVFSASTVAGAFIDSLAVAVIGGLATSTVFTLVGLPVWYTLVEDVGAVLRGALPRLAPGRARFPRDAVCVGGDGAPASHVRRSGRSRPSPAGS